MRREEKELQALAETKAFQEQLAQRGMAVVPDDVDEQIRQREELVAEEIRRQHLEHCRERIETETPEKFRRDDITVLPKVAQWQQDLWTLDRHEFADAKNGLILVGRPGAGKTQTMWLIIRDLLEHGHENFKFVKANHLFKELLTRSNDRRTNADYIEKLSKTDILMVDDLAAKKLTEAQEVWFQEILDERFEQQLITVISTNIGVPEWVNYFGDRNASRIGGLCRTVLFPNHDHRTGITYK